MERGTAKFATAPLGTGTWLVRERADRALLDTLVPPGVLPPGTGGGLESCWRLCSYADALLGRDGDVEETRLLTVKEALAFARADDEQAAWVYERSLFYAQHLLTVAVEHFAHDRTCLAEICQVLTNPAVQLLDEVRRAAGVAGLSDRARGIAVGVLPDLALVVLGISEDEAHADLVATRA